MGQARVHRNRLSEDSRTLKHRVPETVHLRRLIGGRGFAAHRARSGLIIEREDDNGQLDHLLVACWYILVH